MRFRRDQAAESPFFVNHSQAALPMENHPPGRAFLVDTGADGWRLGVHDRRHCRGRIGSEHMFQPYESGQVLATQNGNVGDTVSRRSVTVQGLLERGGTRRRGTGPG
jgi:hypothetical protein